MQRAALQGVDYTKADKFQQFLEQEADRELVRLKGDDLSPIASKNFNNNRGKWQV